MKILKHCVVAALLASLAVGVTAGAADAHGQICTSVKAKGVGVTNPDGVTTSANITGLGLPVGTTLGGPFALGGAPPVFTLSGPVVFTAKVGSIAIGTLTTATTGTLDVTNGAFTSAGPITASSGILRGVTGNLVFKGVQNLATGTFTEDITGKLCA